MKMELSTRNVEVGESLKIDNEMVQYLVHNLEGKSIIILKELNKNMQIDLSGKPHASHQAFF